MIKHFHYGFVVFVEMSTLHWFVRGAFTCYDEFAATIEHQVWLRRISFPNKRHSYRKHLLLVDIVT